MPTTNRILTLLAIILAPLAIAPAAGQTPVLIGKESCIPIDPAWQGSGNGRYVQFRPTDGSVVDLNPPRFSWPYLPQIQPGEIVKGGVVFTLQISSTPDFRQLYFEAKDTPYNFYNFLPPLQGAKTWFWRVKYLVEGKETWSQTRSFTLADGAVVWDRSRFGKIVDGIRGHPRMLFRPANRQAFLELQKKDPAAGKVAEVMIKIRDARLGMILKGLPDTDQVVKSGEKLSTRELRERGRQVRADGINYFQMSSQMAELGFGCLLAGEKLPDKLKACYLKMISWPYGGSSSPEGSTPLAHGKYNNHVAYFLGLLYDWFYDDWTPAERKAIRDCIEWRVEKALHHSYWGQPGTRMALLGSAIMYESAGHAWENLVMNTMAALSICDESPVARQALELGLHYLVGISKRNSPEGPDQVGSQYATGGLMHLLEVVWLLQMAAPELELYKLKVLDSTFDHIARLLPVGTRHSSFGSSGGVFEDRWLAQRAYDGYLLACLTGNRQAAQNYQSSLVRMKELQRGSALTPTMLMYALPLYAGQWPEPQPETELVRIFPPLGWAMCSTKPPSDYSAFRDAIHWIFMSCPPGGRVAPFMAQNSFEIHAYGETITGGGGSCHHWLSFCASSLSHNTVLVNGHGQETTATPDKFLTAPACGRLLAFRRGDHFVYVAGEASGGYTRDVGLQRFVRHIVFVDNAYFVVYDDLAMRDDAQPATFQWLYHVQPPAPFTHDPGTFALKYQMGDTRVVLRHLAHARDLTFENRRGFEGYWNPLTKEDHRPPPKVLAEATSDPKMQRMNLYPDAHHFWVSHKTPAKAMQFLAVIVPMHKDDVEPRIDPVGDQAVRVAFRGRTTSVSFSTSTKADLIVDSASLKD